MGEAWSFDRGSGDFILMVLQQFRRFGKAHGGGVLMVGESQILNNSLPSTKVGGENLVAKEGGGHMECAGKAKRRRRFRGGETATFPPVIRRRHGVSAAAKVPHPKRRGAALPAAFQNRLVHILALVARACTVAVWMR